MGLVSFRGRLRRPIFTLVHVLTSAALIGLVFVALLIAMAPRHGAWSGGEVAFLVALGLAALLVLLVRTSVEVRRLHDLGLSGWWSPLVLLLVAACLVLAYRTGRASAPGEPAWTWPLAQAVPTMFFLLLALVRGTQGPNRHGARPASPWSLRGAA
jgi:uncharacterized membrane protein YhaH (DUF805 family)